MMVSLARIPVFRRVRSKSGSITTDPAVFDLSNYPLDELPSPGSADEIAFYWRADGTLSTDTLSISALQLDASRNGYTVGTTVTSVKANQLKTVSVAGSPAFLIVTAVSVTAATNLEIWAAQVFPPPYRRPISSWG